MSKPTRQFVEGVLAAQVAVAEVTSALPIGGMSQDTWNVICKINLRLCEIALATIEQIEKVK